MAGDDVICVGMPAEGPVPPCTRCGDVPFVGGVSTPELGWVCFGCLTDEEQAAGVEPIGPHDLRHACASVMIAAGINAKALSTYMGHSSITNTLDLYGHLMPGYMDEAAGMLDAYLARADTTGRVGQLDPRASI